MLFLQLFSLLLVSFTLASPAKRKLDEALQVDKRPRTNSVSSTSDSEESSDPFEEIESDDESYPTAPFSHGPIHDKISRQGHYISYDRARKSPHWVSEHLTKESLRLDLDLERKRPSTFYEDKSIPRKYRALLSDYKYSGFDRGHMASASNNKVSLGAFKESFILSNIAPQVGFYFNSGRWNDLEIFLRKGIASFHDIWVVSGVAYLPTTYPDGRRFVRYQVLGDGQVPVPTHYYKAVLAFNRTTNEYYSEYFLLKNENTPDYIPLSTFLSITGMNFFPILKATPSNVCSVLDCESVVYYPKLWMNFMTGRYRGENTSVPWTVPKGFIIPGSNGFQAGKVSGIYDVDIEIGRFDYAMKKEIRELGARWDHEKKHWYIPAGIDISPFSDYYPIIPRGVSPKTMMTGVQISDAILQTKFSDKDIVKRLGAKWNGKNWNVEAGMDVTPFAKWNPTIPAVDESREPIYYFSRVFINVPFKDIDKVKGYGALWDKDIQRWYIPSGIDASLFSRWNPEVEGLTPISDAVVPSVDMEVDQVSDEDIIEPMHI